VLLTVHSSYHQLLLSTIVRLLWTTISSIRLAILSIRCDYMCETIAGHPRMPRPAAAVILLLLLPAVGQWPRSLCQISRSADHCWHQQHCGLAASSQHTLTTLPRPCRVSLDRDDSPCACAAHIITCQASSSSSSSPASLAASTASTKLCQVRAIKQALHVRSSVRSSYCVASNIVGNFEPVAATAVSATRQWKRHCSSDWACRSDRSVGIQPTDQSLRHCTVTTHFFLIIGSLAVSWIP
jgi:hypothetical protein